MDELGTISPKLENPEEQSPAPTTTRSSVIVHYGPSSPHPAKAVPCNSPVASLAPSSPPLMANHSPPPLLVAGSPPQRSPASLLAGPAPALQVGHRVFRGVSIKLSLPGGDRTKACASSPGGCDKPEEGDGDHLGEARDDDQQQQQRGKTGDLDPRREEAGGGGRSRSRSTKAGGGDSASSGSAIIE